jgi:hypothetical protein
MPRSMHIVSAFADPDDLLPLAAAYRQCDVNNQVDAAHGYVQLMDHLPRRPAHLDARPYPMRGFVQVALSRPRMDGREALAQVQFDELLHGIPAVVSGTCGSKVSGLDGIAHPLGRHWLASASRKS